MPSIDREHEPLATLPSAAPSDSAAVVLTAYLRRVETGQAESRDDLCLHHAVFGEQLRRFFEIHDRLTAAAAATPAAELHGAVTLTGSIAPDTQRILALAQTLDGRTNSESPPASSSAKPGSKSFGDYELLELIAKGGMGAVYKARQRRLNRIVAVKMILAGQFADQQDIDRFYAEAEAAANLRHPNIVAIHEVGVFEGQHFFSMDYIPGKSLSELVRQNPLSPKQAAEHVRTIARAMQFAHAQGILHRDLKPSNVLLDKSGDPLITDFGLAKRVSGQSQLTATGAVIGTPSYMPPEQAAAESDKVGPASDVYSIGAILYELVTGRPPFIAATVMLTIRQVLESDPVSPRLLNSGVPRDLETICLKCLQKEPAARYATAQELVDELTRFLAGEPILARPVGPLARTVRWCRRNPWVASFAALAACGFLVALAASTIGYLQTSAALEDSEESFRQAQAAVDELFTEVSEDTLLNQPGMQPLREKLLRRALAYYERFLEQRGHDPKLRDELAVALFRVGLITDAIGRPDDARKSYERAAQMQRQLVVAHSGQKTALQNLGNTLSALGTLQFKLHDRGGATKVFREAIEVRERLAKLDADDRESQRGLANSYMNLGLLHRESGEPSLAQKEFERAQEIRQRALAHGAEDPKLRRDLGKGYYNLATLALSQAQNEAARRHFTSAIAEFEKLFTADPEDLSNKKLLAVCCRLMGDLESVDGQLDSALAQYQRSHDLLAQLARRNPEVLEYRTELAGVHLNLGDLHREQDNSAAAVDDFRRARDLLAPLVAEHADVPRYRRDLAVALSALAQGLLDRGERENARKDLTESLWHLDRLLADRPEDQDLVEQRSLVVATMKTLDKP